VNAWRLIQAHGDYELCTNVLAGRIAMMKATKHIKPLVRLKTAFKAARAVNPTGCAAFLHLPEVKAFAAAAGVFPTWSPLGHLRAAVTSFGTDQTRELLTHMDEGAEPDWAG
jgi:hypothetical protein